MYKINIMESISAFSYTKIENLKGLIYEVRLEVPKLPTL